MEDTVINQLQRVNKVLHNWRERKNERLERYHALQVSAKLWSARAAQKISVTHTYSAAFTVSSLFGAFCACTASVALCTSQLCL